MRLPPEVKQKIYLYLLGGTTIHIRAVLEKEDGKPIRKPNFKWLSSFCLTSCSQNDALERFRRFDYRSQESEAWPNFVGAKGPQPPDHTTDNIHDFCNRLRKTEKGRRLHTDLLDHDLEDDLVRGSVVDLRWLQVCRQAYAEANPILWTSNIFSFFTPMSLFHFTRTLTTTQRKLVCSVRIEAHRKDIKSPNGWRSVISKETMKCICAVRNLHLEISDEYMTRRKSESDMDDEEPTPYPVKQAAFVAIIFELLQTLSLDRATVSVFTDADVPERKHVQWTHTDRLAWAKRMQDRLEDPEGGRKYKELHETMGQWKRMHDQATSREMLESRRCPFRTQHRCDMYYDRKGVGYHELFERTGKSEGECYCFSLHKKPDGSWAPRDDDLTGTFGSYY